MKALLNFISAFVFCFPVSCPATYFYAGAAGGITYTINEDCEGVGTPSGWTDASSPNWDYLITPAPLAGLQSWFYTGSIASSWIGIADSNTYTATFMFRAADVVPSADSTLGSFRTSAASQLSGAKIITSGAVIVYANGSNSTATVDALAANTTYYFQLKWVDGGTCSVEFNTTDSFTGSGNKFTSKTGGTTTDCTRYYIGSSSSAGLDDIIFDDIKVWVP